MGPFVAGVIVANANESALLAVERMLDCETLAAAVAARGKVWRPGAVPEGNVVEPLVTRKLGAREAVRYGREPGARGTDALEAFLDLGRRPCEEGLEERVFAIAALLPALGAGCADGGSVVVGADRLAAKEGVGEVGGRFARGVVEGLRLAGGVPDGEASGLDAERE